MKLTSDTALAAEWDLTVEELHRRMKRHNWPHVRLGRFDFRFTDEQIAQIVASHTVERKTSATGQTGLTERSARRAS